MHRVTTILLLTTLSSWKLIIAIFTRLTGRSSRLAAAATNYDIYASLPSSFRRELLVRSNVANTDYDTLVKRKAIVESKSPAELSQISTLSEIPLPRKIEEWLQTGGPRYVYVVLTKHLTTFYNSL